MRKRPAFITLLTDFGDEDVYAGVMKGVIAGIAPDARVIDLTHALPKFAVAQAAFRLKQAFPFFPKGTVHVAVVDPGVGSDRRIAAMESQGHFFIAPDNGLLAPIESEHGRSRLVAVTNDAFFRKSVSATFHGRDIFAPVAAHMANGLALSELGPPLDALTPLDCPQPVLTESGTIRGEVLWADRFGNLVTNIPETMLADRAVKSVLVGKSRVDRVARAYAEVESGVAFAMTGSFGMLEIAVRQGSAAKELPAEAGTTIEAVLEAAT